MSNGTSAGRAGMRGTGVGMAVGVAGRSAGGRDGRGGSRRVGMTAREPGEEQSGAVRASEIAREGAARRGSGRSGPMGGRDDGASA